MKYELWALLTPCSKCYPIVYRGDKDGAMLISPTLRIHREGNEIGMTACGYNANASGWYWATSAYGWKR